MNRIISVALVWALIVIAAIVVHESYPRTAPLKAGKPLVSNHQLFTGDVLLPGITGRYLNRDIPAGGDLSAADTALRPLISPRLALVTIEVPLSEVQAGIFDAGKAARLCSGPVGSAAVKVLVVAVLCEGARHGKCTALLTGETGKPSLETPSADAVVAAEGSRSEDKCPKSTGQP